MFEHLDASGLSMLDMATHDIDAPRSIRQNLPALRPEETLKIAPVRRINPDACPFYIMMPGHYRADGTCKCNDPDHRVMRDWGYRWSPRKQRWGA